jgi:CheY-like chemotaxis protein
LTAPALSVRRNFFSLSNENQGFPRLLAPFGCCYLSRFLQMIRNSILIVDDDLGFTYLLHKTLIQFGCSNVHSVINGREAAQHVAGIAAYRKDPPDLIFLDLNMPGAGGQELIDWICCHPTFRDIPVVILSGVRDPEIIDKATKQFVVRAFYEKPAQVEKLRAIVKEVLEKILKKTV